MVLEADYICGFDAAGRLMAIKPSYTADNKHG
jgi:hypothetical protein